MPLVEAAMITWGCQRRSEAPRPGGGDARPRARCAGSRPSVTTGSRRVVMSMSAASSWRIRPDHLGGIVFRSCFRLDFGMGSRCRGTTGHAICSTIRRLA